ncbi:hypothetical protein CVT26_006947 [Gymnopilus dilepis]|uniref:Uncharacterized protein n=1 Tax=Gymnopilus dilepis TaxID=231916 RepID=A0A409W6D3_9AGAR|nr:hypothetical protein CVT26_006947 [Gymnopilus dilepis]
MPRLLVHVFIVSQRLADSMTSTPAHDAQLSWPQRVAGFQPPPTAAIKIMGFCYPSTVFMTPFKVIIAALAMVPLDSFPTVPSGSTFLPTLPSTQHQASRFISTESASGSTGGQTILVHVHSLPTLNSQKTAQASRLEL